MENNQFIFDDVGRLFVLDTKGQLYEIAALTLTKMTIFVQGKLNSNKVQVKGMDKTEVRSHILSLKPMFEDKVKLTIMLGNETRPCISIVARSFKFSKEQSLDNILDLDLLTNFYHLSKE